MTNQDRIKALPTDLASLQRLVLQLQDTVASHQQAKAERAAADAELAAGAGAEFTGELLEVKAELEGLADGSADYTNPRERTRITKLAINLMDRMLAQLQQSK